MLNYHGFKHVTCTDCNDQTGPEINELKNKIGVSKYNNIDKNSFDPTYDTRLHEVIANDLKATFYPNYQPIKEANEADELMARINK